ncbi:MAG TPA: universal stress protein [Allosphingosinicella sp.]|nr:universal stress protein [Allosphingosinicella sp.]
MKSLLLNINPDPGHDARLAAAIALAKSRDGHIVCIQTLIAPLTIGDPGTAAMAPEMMIAMERAAHEFAGGVEARLEAAGVAWSWIRVFGDPAAIIVSHARLADVVILSAQGSNPSIGSVALHAPAPILTVPEKNPGFDVRSPVLIAWNGSYPCANALRASLALLRDADGVNILVVDDDNAEFPAARAFDYLSRHGIAAEIHRRDSDGGPVAEVILTFAQRLEAGSVVAGAFGHNRLREMLLGSVTRALLKGSPIPLFLAH